MKIRIVTILRMRRRLVNVLFQYYEEDMMRMQKEMDDLASMYQTTGTSASTAPSVRPQIKHPRAPSSSGSENGSCRQRHSSGASDAELPTPQPTVIQKPLVGKSLDQVRSKDLSDPVNRVNMRKSMLSFCIM